MIHELECDYAGTVTIGSPCRLCAALRYAYGRGREDAAKAVGELLCWTCWSPHHTDDCTVSKFKAIAAARGDGTEDHRSECWECESCNDPDCGCLGCGIARGDGEQA